MSYRRVIQLWEGNNEETHGGENNGGARRVFCPRSAKYSDLPGLSSWTGRRAFGFFESGHGDDPVRGGGVAGQENTVDYITGMPDLRSEHLHAIDCGGFDKLRIVWKAECLDYEGLKIDWSAVPNDTNNSWADAVFAVAYGEEVVDAALDYVNFPPALWANALDTLAGEGVGSNIGTLQILNNPPLTSGTNWSVAGDFALSAGTAVYTHATGTGTLTQTTGNFAGAAIASKKYTLKYEVTSSTVAGGTMTLTGLSSTTVTLPRTNGTHTVTFTTHATPGNLVITCTSTSGAITLDNIFCAQDMRPGADKRPRPLIMAASNGAFNDSILTAMPGALAIRGQSYVYGAATDMAKYSQIVSPRGLPIVGHQVAWGALQWGITAKFSDGSIYGHTPRGGDRYKVVLDIGNPTMSSGATATPATAGADARPVEMNITGLERVYFAMCSVSADFVANLGTGLTPTYLHSDPIAPATAPRQHIKGRLYAILSSTTPHPKGSPA